MNQFESVKQDIQKETDAETPTPELACELTQIEPDVLAMVAGGPDGAAIGHN